MKVNSNASRARAVETLDRYGDWAKVRAAGKPSASGVVVLPARAKPQAPKQRKSMAENARAAG